MRWIMVAVAAGIGCGSPATETVTPIGEFPELHLEMTADGLEVVLGDEDGYDQSEPCAVVRPDLAVRLDDMDASVVEPGAFIDYEFDEYAFNCAPPRLHIATAPPYGLSRLELHDATGTVTCILPDLMATREMELVPPRPWTLPLGKPVTVRWSPASDLSVLVPDVTLLTERNAQISVDDVTIDDDRLSFTMPAVDAGAYKLMVRLRGMSCGASPMTVEVTSKLTQFEAIQPITVGF